MEETNIGGHEDRYLRWNRRARLILGWFGITFALYLLGFAIYGLITGQFNKAALVSPGILVGFFGGFLLVRPEQNRQLR